MRGYGNDNYGRVTTKLLEKTWIFQFPLSKRGKDTFAQDFTSSDIDGGTEAGDKFVKGFT
jgi:hypothetical protein